MTENEIDNEFMDRIKAGDESGLHDLMARYSRRIRWYYLQRSICDDTSDELIQDVFLSVWRKASQFRFGESVRAWLFTIARNAMINRIRHERRKHRETALSQLMCYTGSGSVCDGNSTINDVVDASPAEPVDVECMTSVASRVLSRSEFSAFEDMLQSLDTHEMASKRGVCECTIRWRRSSAIKSLRDSHEFASEFAPANV